MEIFGRNKRKIHQSFLQLPLDMIKFKEPTVNQ